MIKKGLTLALAASVLAGGVAYGQSSLVPDQKLVKVLRTTNKAQTNHYVTKAYEFRSNNPYNARRFLQRPLAVEEGGIFTFGHPDQGGVVVMICPEHQVPYYDDLMGVLDNPSVSSADGSKRVYKKVKNRSVGDADFIGTLSSFLTTNSWLYTDEETNSIYVSDAPSGANTLLAMLDGDIDVPTEQVDIEVTIYEVDLANDGTLGLDFHAWKNGPGRNLFAAGGFYEREHTDGMTVTGIPGKHVVSRGGNAAYQYNVPSAYFDALAVKGNARVLTRTTMSVLNTDAASLSAGDQILYYDVQNGPAPVGGTRDGLLDERDWNGDYPNNRTVTGTLRAIESGVALDVTPIVGDETINLEVNYTVSTLTGFDAEGHPLVATTSIGAIGPDDELIPIDVRVADGEEVIIGGLTHEEKVKTTRKVPILGSIPILGYWFGGEVTTSRKRMVAIVMRPTVVGFDAGNVTLAADDVIGEFGH